MLNENIITIDGHKSVDDIRNEVIEIINNL
jgi:thymidylate kinase